MTQDRGQAPFLRRGGGARAGGLRRRRRRRRRGEHRARARPRARRRRPTLDAVQGRQGHRHDVRRQGHQRRADRGDRALQHSSTRPTGLKVKLLELAADATDGPPPVHPARRRPSRPTATCCSPTSSGSPSSPSRSGCMDLTRLRERRARTSSSRRRWPPYDYDGKLWGLPQVTGAGLLYRRTDQVADAPATWQELYEEGAANDGFAYQGAPYEGLTCNFVELSSAAGGRDPLRGRQEGRVRLARRT